MTPRLRAFLALPLLLLLGTRVAHAAAAAPGTYELVDLRGQAYRASSLAFTREGVRTLTPAGPRTLQSADIDWYETFWRNVRSGATNVIVFRTGSLLRFDRLELQGGQLVLTAGGGGQLTLAESLIDFEQSVREGAMVKLPEGAGAVQVSRSSGGAWTPDDGGGGDEAATAGPSRRRPGVASRRRAGSLGQAPVAAGEDAVPMEVAEPMEEPEPMDTHQPHEAEAPSEQQQPGGSNLGGSPFPRRGGFGRDKSNEGGSGGASGQAVVTVSTDYSGPIGGLQVLLQYPPTNIQVVEPVAFTGFAANWLATPNSTVAGQISIGGAANPGTTIGGGEFLRVTFVWTGTPPSRQQFRLSQLQAVTENSETIQDFRTTMDVQVSP